MEWSQRCTFTPFLTEGKQRLASVELSSTGGITSLRALTQLTCIPNVSGGEPIVTLRPRNLGVRLVVNVHIEVIAKRKPKAIGENVVVPSDKARQHGFVR